MERLNEKEILIDLNANFFNYQIEIPDKIDWDKLEYNPTYKSFDYYANKFPTGWEYLTGFEKIIENMAKNAKSPLEEMEDRIKSIDMYNDKQEGNNTNFFEFKDSR
jgi:hypothetical protein